MIGDTHLVWTIVVILAVGTFLIRFSFLALTRGRQLPAWLLRHLRYTPVAVIPGLVAPLVLWPSATGGDPDAARLLAALATLVAGLLTKNLLASVAVGAAVLYSSLAVFA